MIRISNVKLRYNYKEDELPAFVSRKLRIAITSIKEVSVFRRSIDARKKENVHFLATLDVKLTIPETAFLAENKDPNISKATTFSYFFKANKKLKKQPIVVGAGPAGLFAALSLSLAGEKPIIIERGKDVKRREKDILSFWNNKQLNPNSNIQFGEGGAGTFSDGKLNTGTKDKRARFVLQEFVKCGAPKEILFDAKPHIGTDNLPKTIKALREKIISLGGEVRFETTLTDITIKNDKVIGVKTLHDNSITDIDTDTVILAIGHSARDTFEFINNKNVFMQQKAFSVGARIEHLQSKINEAQYGKYVEKGFLNSADYKLSAHLTNGRGVYTFCMCPGGTVVAASSEPNMLCTNGMSKFARNETNANSALLVGITPKDFGSEDVLAGIEFQRKLERKAFELGGGNYNAPAQRVGDFLQNKKTTSLGSVKPSYTAGYTLSNLHDCLPKYITESMEQGIMQMNRRLSGFANPDAILTGVETRSSSPVRILRGESFESINVGGLYPCGEGAGYAGGIISAAVDGIKCAEAILNMDILK